MSENPPTVPTSAPAPASQGVPPLESKKERTIEIPKELLEQNGTQIVLSHSQAKQLLSFTKKKYPRTEKQLANIERLKQLNQERYQKMREQKEATLKAGKEQVAEAVKAHEEKAKEKKKQAIQITVLPKKQVKKKPPPPPSSEEEEEDDDSEDEVSSAEEVEVKQPKKQVKAKLSTKQIKHKMELVKEIDRMIQPPQGGRYSHLIHNMF